MRGPWEDDWPGWRDGWAESAEIRASDLGPSQPSMMERPPRCVTPSSP